MNPPTNEPDWLSELVTTTSTTPAACDAVTHVIDVALTTTTEVQAVPPKVAPAPARNPVPVIVTAVPPRNGPTIGVIETTVGAAYAIFIVIVAVTEPDVDPDAVIVSVAVDAAVGVPDTTPVEVLIASPAGKVPVVTA